MSKKLVVLVLAIAICFAAAEPVSKKSLRRRVSARQQLAQPAPTGYPPAGVTPAVPFDLPTETQEPDTVYGPPAAEPDIVYGPPASEPDEVYGPPAAEPDVVYGPPIAEPDIVYGPPAAEPDVVYGPPDQPDAVYGPPQTEEKPEPDTVYGPPETESQELDTVNGPPKTEEFTNVQLSEVELEGEVARLVYQSFPQRRQPHTSVPARLILAKTRRPSNILYTARYRSH